jgi:hypothetical protein
VRGSAVGAESTALPTLSSILVTDAGWGGGSRVRIFDAANGRVSRALRVDAFLAHDAAFTAGASLAATDVNDAVEQHSEDP